MIFSSQSFPVNPLIPFGQAQRNEDSFLKHWQEDWHGLNDAEMEVHELRIPCQVLFYVSSS